MEKKPASCTTTSLFIVIFSKNSFFCRPFWLSDCFVTAFVLKSGCKGMGFSHTIQMFSKENEKKSNGFPFIWQNWREKCSVHIIFIYAREGKLSMIPLWVFLRFESAGLSILLSKWFGWWFLNKKPGYTPDMFARLRLVWRRQASAYERKLSTRKPDTDRRWWLCVTTSKTYRAINHNKPQV